MLAAGARRHERRLEAISGAAIFALAFGVRAALVFALRYYTTSLDLESEISHIAAEFAKSWTFANPYMCATGPTAHAAPAFPMILGAIYRALAPGSTREIAICLLGTAVSSTIYALLPWLAVSLGFRRIVGVVAGVIGAAIPLFFWIEARGIWDAPYVCLFLVLCTAATLELHPGASLRQIATAGAAWGIAFWFAPSLLPVFLVCMAILFWRWLPSSRALAVVFALGIPAIAVATPWIVRNYAQFHSVFWMRDNFGLELHTSNNPAARPNEADNREHTDSFQVHPNGRAAPCATIQREGEISYFKRQQRLALDWIGSHPVAFLRLTLARAFYFWFLPLSSPVKQLASAVLTVVALGALVLMLRTPAARLLLLILLAYSAVYYIIQVDPRFRYPLHPLILMGASAGVYSAVKNLRHYRQPQ
jgi:MFS family permease